MFGHANIALVTCYRFAFPIPRARFHNCIGTFKNLFYLVVRSLSGLFFMRGGEMAEVVKMMNSLEGFSSSSFLLAVPNNYVEVLDIHTSARSQDGGQVNNRTMLSVGEHSQDWKRQSVTCWLNRFIKKVDFRTNFIM